MPGIPVVTAAVYSTLPGGGGGRGEKALCRNLDFLGGEGGEGGQGNSELRHMSNRGEGKKEIRGEFTDSNVSGF